MSDELLKELQDELSAIVGESHVSASPTVRRVYATDMWPKLLIHSKFGKAPTHLPQVVVWPKTEREIKAIVRYANEAKIALVPYGGGSGVCGGVVPLRGGITVDLKRLDDIKSISRENMAVDVETGKIGERFERDLASKGFTFGHFPSSIYSSTVGGWLACRAAGQLSTKYGKIEDRVLGLTMVTGKGDVIETDGMQRAMRGPNWNQAILGSEGCFGIITSARLRLSPAPDVCILRGFEFENVQQGMDAIRNVMQSGLRPAVIRLYDGFDTFMHKVSIFSSDKHASLDPHQFAPLPEQRGETWPLLPTSGTKQDKHLGERLMDAISSPKDILGSLKQFGLNTALSSPSLVNQAVQNLSKYAIDEGCRMIVGLEGPRVRTEVEAKLTFSKLKLAGGEDKGEEPGQEWLEKRYAVSYKLSSVFRQGLFVDTMEISTTWDKLSHLYKSVREAIGRHAVVMAHFSHAYHEGCSIYFTFAAQADDQEKTLSTYEAIWRDGLNAAIRAGGSISHHHGIGMLKSSFMRAEHSQGMTAINALKKTFDPMGIMNPGKLGLFDNLGSNA